MVLVKVKGYRRKGKNKIVTVPSHKRHMRSLGKKISYKPVGQFYVAHDNYGNFRGSKIKMNKSIRSKPSKPQSIKRRRTLKYKTSKQLDTDYYTDVIGYPDWIEGRKRLKRIA